MDCAETSTAESRQYIRESYASVLRLRASVARAGRAIAKSQRIIEQHRASAPAMADRADETMPAWTFVDHHRASAKDPMGKMANQRSEIAARIVQVLRQAGFGCEFLSPLPLN
jgi:hypothetical protein